MPSNCALEIQHSMKKHLLIDFITFFWKQRCYYTCNSVLWLPTWVKLCKNVKHCHKKIMHYVKDTTAFVPVGFLPFFTRPWTKIYNNLQQLQHIQVQTWKPTRPVGGYTQIKWYIFFRNIQVIPAGVLIYRSPHICSPIWQKHYFSYVQLNRLYQQLSSLKPYWTLNHMSEHNPGLHQEIIFNLQFLNAANYTIYQMFFKYKKTS